MLLFSLIHLLLITVFYLVAVESLLVFLDQPYLYSISTYEQMTSSKLTICNLLMLGIKIGKLLTYSLTNNTNYSDYTETVVNL